MTADNHIHTAFSPDGEGESETFVLRAISCGMRHLIFTEHVDNLYCDPAFGQADLEKYFARVRALREKYRDRIYIGAGLEVGYTTQNKLLNIELLETYRPDYVINSVHQVGANDCWFAAYFADKTPREACRAYLAAVRESLDAPYPFHAVGHIGYVLRNAPFDTFLLPDFAAEIDDILRVIVQKGLILEINTSCRKPWLVTVPERGVIERYVALGGRKLNFASDAHRPEDVGRSYAVARDTALSCGITHQTVLQNGKEVSLPF